ncbi:hypothetical protein OG321_42045 [Streptomyces sp. NBC_00424]|uniref:hypothetical protein n=1 Tax=Streptomyces sp. NBC_00424 TaxID=2903648 RepID=UPI00224F041C|nr:hypothetical protein [Streptomyces sp. NBC_00424]MCX5078983.1 hypothetical protein [Streptomyces sp. NBC_00424]
MRARPCPEPIDTVERILALLGWSGLERGNVLRVEGEGGLAFASGLEVAEAKALLRGDRSAAGRARAVGRTPVATRHRQVVDRIVFLRRTRLKVTEDGGRRTYPLSEIAASAGMSVQWLDRMLKTGRAPNLDHAAEIAGFFGEGVEFLTDPPAMALDRVLRRIHTDLLERTVERQNHDLRQLRNAGSADVSADPSCEISTVACHAAHALADVPDDTAQPLFALIESVARLPR